MKYRPIKEIAIEIYESWERPYYGALPYLEAMMTLNNIDDMYYTESASSIINYFLSNASSFRGENARRLKIELNSIILSA